MLPSVLARQLEQGLKDYIETTFPVSTPMFQDTLKDLLDRPQGLFKGPYISIKLPFRPGSVGENAFKDIPFKYDPYLHQERAFERLGGEETKSTIIATGTGSGKTECFLFPILDYCYRHHTENGIKAIIIYPMNALATDQAKRLAHTIYHTPALKNNVTAGLYIGQHEKHPSPEMGPEKLITDKNIMHQTPPDILLTNYKMLDLLLIRPHAYGLWRNNGPETLKFIVVDELHTFDGAQGTDLACLLRRLKHRLATPKKHICCVGTSATLGGKDDMAQLTEYASSVFSEDFEPDSVITEELLTAEEFCSGDRDIDYHLPNVAALNGLESLEDPQEYKYSIVKAWYGSRLQITGEDEEPFELGWLLKHHAFLKALLQTIGNRAVSVDDILAGLDLSYPDFKPMDTEHKRQLVYSFTNLLSIARLQVKNKAAPFLQVRFQLWQRELRRLVGSVASTPVLKFSDDLKPAELEQHLPVIHCRECGAMGWGGSKQKQDQGVDPDLQQFYIHFFNHDTATVFLFPRETDQHGEWLCGHCLNISTSRNIKSCPFCASSDRLVPVTLSIITRQKDDKIHHTHNCPFCGGAESLTIIGLRASGMISVSIGQLFSSGFNDDKKLLAFSDSVQDASHKAGFFSARTFRFNFRSAVQQYLNKTGKPVVLSELPQQFINYYRRIWNDEKYIATFIAPNMTWFDDFSHLLLTGKAPAGLIPDINKRIGWEIFSEFGFNCRIGRTLEKTGSSIAVPDTARLQETVNLLLEPLQNEFGQLRNLTQSELILFLTGLLTQMKTRGAFEHPLLNAYKNSFGNAFLLNRVNILPDFGIYARTPVFLTIKRGTRFDTLLSGPSHGNTWYQNWVIKCFTHLDLSINSVMDDVLNKTVSALEKSGFLNQEIAGNFPIWSLAPSHFTVVTQVVQLRCDKCGHQHSIADHEKSDWDNAPCMRYNCSGTYSLQPTRNDYYRRLYALGSITRLYIEEHTGLLSRDEREELERRFMRDEAKNRKPWDPNALSCTPTLEMGINIGDLSSLILCSVPPDQSKYLQRIGRAGRRDGNSINVTVANGRAHDLYFYHEPETMMNGPVNPPGCFLNAPAVLERQLCAFSFDSWIREMQGQVVIPDKVKRVLSNFHKKDAQLFPNNWLAFVEQNKDRLIWEFIGLFPTGTKTETLEHLEQFLKGTSGEEGSLSYRIILELAELDREVNSYKDRIRKITQAIKQLQSNPAARDQNYDRVMAELEREKDALNGIINNILDRNVYNYMTDEGFLPNYTFPEAGVVLRSIIYRRRKLDSPTKYQTFTFEYERPAVSAIQELAPANRFYAQGRRVKIDQVDTRLSKFEEWIFCPNCPYMELAAISEDKKTCPLCGSINWSDAGQKRNMLRLRQVFATTSDRNSRSHDESDEREPEFYHKHMMVHAEHKDVKRAFIIDSDQVPFGFEFLTRAQFREINFGNKKTLSEEIEIAGQKFPRKGFELCKECGRVKNNKDIDHHLSCSFRNKPDDKSVVQSSYLYREFSSEALRILMPVTSFDTSDTKLHSFIAAFILGLKVKFRGNIDHLRTTTLDEPDPASQIRKKYLVLYDTVPGGTGYLKELLRGDKPLMEVFEGALGVMKSCTCNSDPEKDGCYGCVYQYRNSYDMPSISRNTAIEMFSRIVANKQKLIEIQGSIRGISVHPILESELEARFIEILSQAKFAGKPVAVKKRVVEQKPGWRIEINGHIYDIVPQVELVQTDQVVIPARADFMIYPVKSCLKRPIALFCDGYAWHAGKRKTQSRVGKDMAQRMAIVRSGRFYIWSLTWADLEKRIGTPHYDNFLAYNPTMTLYLEKIFKSRDDQLFFRELEKLNSFELFCKLLGNPEIDNWNTFSVALAVSQIQPEGGQPVLKQTISEFEQVLRHSGSWQDVNFDTVTKQSGGDYFFGITAKDYQDKPKLKLLVSATKTAIQNMSRYEISPCCRFFDDDDIVDQLDFKKAWNGFLRLFNIYQFVPNALFVTSKGLADHEYDHSIYNWIEKEKKPITGGEDFKELYDITDPKYHPVLTYLIKHKLPLPEIGYELLNDKNRVTGQAEMAWPPQKIAFLHEQEMDFKKEFEQKSWQVWELKNILENLSICDTLLRSNKDGK